MTSMACDKDGYFMNKTNKIRYVIPFILYMGLLIYFLLFAEAFRENAVDEYRYNLIPFREIMRYIQYHKTIGTGRVLLNLLGNIIGFAPFGFFLPCISTDRSLGGNTFFHGVFHHGRSDPVVQPRGLL